MCISLCRRLDIAYLINRKYNFRIVYCGSFGELIVLYVEDVTSVDSDTVTAVGVDSRKNLS